MRDSAHCTSARDRREPTLAHRLRRSSEELLAAPRREGRWTEMNPEAEQYLPKTRRNSRCSRRGCVRDRALVQAAYRLQMRDCRGLARRAETFLPGWLPICPECQPQ